MAESVCCREEGSNGDREMSSAVWAAGMQPWDVSMSDLLSGRISLEQFRGEALLLQETLNAVQNCC